MMCCYEDIVVRLCHHVMRIINIFTTTTCSRKIDKYIPHINKQKRWLIWKGNCTTSETNWPHLPVQHPREIQYQLLNNRAMPAGEAKLPMQEGGRGGYMIKRQLQSYVRKLPRRKGLCRSNVVGCSADGSRGDFLDCEVD